MKTTSDTSVISTVSSYESESKRNRYNKYNTSFCNRYWFHIITIVLGLIIMTTSSILIYTLFQQTKRNQERRRIQKEFQNKYGFANKVLDAISKDGAIAKWFKANHSQTFKIFRELIQDMLDTIFEE